MFATVRARHVFGSVKSGTTHAAPVGRATCRPCPRHLTRASHAGSEANAAAPVDPFAEILEYQDNWLDMFFINYFTLKMSEQLGGKTSEFKGYEGFVDVSREIMKGRNKAQQGQMVERVLESLLPPQAPARFRAWFPPSQWSLELNALITTVFFRWLVGEMELREIELPDPEGKREGLIPMKSVVYIKKCRYLENSGCVGMCVNMCKLPTQDFFTDTFGLPLTMNPNYEDLSCEMIFGQPPPPIEEDPVATQPCFSQCKLQRASVHGGSECGG